MCIPVAVFTWRGHVVVVGAVGGGGGVAGVRAFLVAVAGAAGAGGLRSNSVTRQVSFNRTKLVENAKIQMRHFE